MAVPTEKLVGIVNADAVIYSLNDTCGYAFCPETKENVYFGTLQGSTNFTGFPFELLCPGQKVSITTADKLPEGNEKPGFTDTLALNVTGHTQVSPEIIFGRGTLTDVEAGGLRGCITTQDGTRCKCPRLAYSYAKGDEFSLSDLIGKEVHFMSINVDPVTKKALPFIVQVHPFTAACSGPNSKKMLSHWTDPEKTKRIVSYSRQDKEGQKAMDSQIYSMRNCYHHVMQALMVITKCEHKVWGKRVLEECQNIFLHACFSHSKDTPPDLETIKREIHVLVTAGLVDYRKLAGIDEEWTKSLKGTEYMFQIKCQKNQPNPWEGKEAVMDPPEPQGSQKRVVFKLSREEEEERIEGKELQKDGQRSEKLRKMTNQEEDHVRNVNSMKLIRGIVSGEACDTRNRTRRN